MAMRKFVTAAAMAALFVSGTAMAASVAPVRASETVSIQKGVKSLGRKSRASSKAENENSLAGGVVLGGLALAAVVGGVVIAADGGSSN